MAKSSHLVFQNLQFLVDQQGHRILAGESAETPGIVAIGATSFGLPSRFAVGSRGWGRGKGSHCIAVFIEIESAGHTGIGGRHKGVEVQRF